MRALVAALAVTLGLGLTACKATDNSDPNIATPPPAAAGTPSSAAGTQAAPTKAAKKPSASKLPDGVHQVIYQVGGTATKAMITYMTPSGEEQINGAHVPWHKTLKAKDFEMLSISAQNSGSGTITCEIDIDGKVKKRSKSSGAYAIVSCDASLGF